MAILENGQGTPYPATIDEDGRVHAQTTIENYADTHAFLGHRYNINTGDLTLTSANESALLYIKNNDTKDLVIDSFVYIIGASTGGSGNTEAMLLRNPTAGTIVSDATAVSINVNMNFGSNRTLSNVLAYKGAEGKTLTDGTDALGSIMTAPLTNVVTVGKLILPNGQSLGIQLTPPSGNTSMKVQIAALCYLNQFDPA